MRQTIKVLIAILLLLGSVMSGPTTGSADIAVSGKVITQGPPAPGFKQVALTFDDGPDPVYTPQVLAILKKYNIKATFFVIGNRVAEQPELVKSLLDDGHELENHTYSHPNLTEQSLTVVRREIVDAQRVITAASNREPVYFRPPRKQYNQQVVDTAHGLGLTTVLWGICVENQNCSTPSQMASRVLKSAHPGLIILAHDGLLDRSNTVKALPLIIEGMQQQGYQFVTLEDLLSQS